MFPHFPKSNRQIIIIESWSSKSRAGSSTTPEYNHARICPTTRLFRRPQYKCRQADLPFSATDSPVTRFSRHDATVQFWTLPPVKPAPQHRLSRRRRSRRPPAQIEPLKIDSSARRRRPYSARARCRRISLPAYDLLDFQRDEFHGQRPPQRSLSTQHSRAMLRLSDFNSHYLPVVCPSPPPRCSFAPEVP